MTAVPDLLVALIEGGVSGLMDEVVLLCRREQNWKLGEIS